MELTDEDIKFLLHRYQNVGKTDVDKGANWLSRAETEIDKIRCAFTIDNVAKEIVYRQDNITDDTFTKDYKNKAQQDELEAFLLAAAQWFPRNFHTTYKAKSFVDVLCQKFLKIFNDGLTLDKIPEEILNTKEHQDELHSKFEQDVELNKAIDFYLENRMMLWHFNSTMDDQNFVIMTNHKDKAYDFLLKSLERSGNPSDIQTLTKDFTLKSYDIDIVVPIESNKDKQKLL